MQELNVMSEGVSSHATRPPSGAYIWLNCPGSVHLGKGVEDKKPEAMLGTAAHSLASYCLEHDTEPHRYMGESIMVQDGEFVDTFRVDDNMRLAVEEYLNFCRSLELPGCIVGIEQKVDLTWCHPELHGTLDYSSFDPKTKTLDIVDYKHGEGLSVSPELNPQLLIYAIGCISELKNRGTITQQAVKQIRMIRLNIVQPRDRNNPVSVRSWGISYEDLEQWMFNILVPAVLRTDDPNAPLCAGPWCTWCNAVCETRIARAEEIMGTTVNSLALPDHTDMDPARFGRVLAFLDELGGWRKKAEAHAINMLERGIEIPGHKLVKRRSNRKWKDTSEVATNLGLILGDDMYEQKMVTITQAEAVLKKRKLNVDVLKPLITKPDTGNTIALASSKTPAVVVRPMFREFIEDHEMFK